MPLSEACEAEKGAGYFLGAGPEKLPIEHLYGFSRIESRARQGSEIGQP